MIVEVLDKKSEFFEEAEESRKIRAGIVRKDEVGKDIQILNRAALLTYPKSSEHVMVHVDKITRKLTEGRDKEKEQKAREEVESWEDEHVVELQEEVEKETGIIKTKQGVHNPKSVAEEIWR